MAKQQPIEIFMPPNMLKAKVGGAVGGIDMAAIKRAEAAMETLKSEFADWLADDVARLVEAATAIAAAATNEGRAQLLRAAHDLKGQADTFDYPLIARMAASLTKLMDEIDKANAIPLGLVDAHVSGHPHRVPRQDHRGRRSGRRCARRRTGSACEGRTGRRGLERNRVKRTSQHDLIQRNQIVL